jgi:hypothetical protein
LLCQGVDRIFWRWWPSNAFQTWKREASELPFACPFGEVFYELSMCLSNIIYEGAITAYVYLLVPKYPFQKSIPGMHYQNYYYKFAC